MLSQVAHIPEQSPCSPFDKDGHQTKLICARHSCSSDSMSSFEKKGQHFS